MKILQVTPFFCPVAGGSALVPYQLSKELAKRGHEVVVYTSDDKLSEEWVKSAQELQIRVLPFRIWLNWANFHVTPGILTPAKEEVKTFDIIHMHNYRSFQNIVVHYYARKHSVPYVLEAYGSLQTVFRNREFKKTFDSLFGRRIIKDASKVITIPPTEVEQCQKLGGEETKIVQIPNSIDIGEYSELPQKGTFRKEYGIVEKNIILFLGRIDKSKGVDILIKAVAELIKGGRDLKLVIAGADYGHLGYLRKLAESLDISNKTIFPGFISPEMKLAAYVDSDVYVLPSIYESFGITVLEACACGTPIIVSDRCQIASLVHNNVGFAVPRNKDQLSEAILNIITNEELRARFGERGRVLIEQQYTLSTRIDRIEAVYKEVVAARTSRTNQGTTNCG